MSLRWGVIPADCQQLANQSGWRGMWFIPGWAQNLWRHNPSKDKQTWNSFLCSFCVWVGQECLAQLQSSTICQSIVECIHIYIYIIYIYISPLKNLYSCVFVAEIWIPSEFAIASHTRHHPLALTGVIAGDRSLSDIILHWHLYLRHGSSCGNAGNQPIWFTWRPSRSHCYSSLLGLLSQLYDEIICWRFWHLIVWPLGLVKGLSCIK